MYWDVVEVRPEPEWKLALRFADGLTGHVQMADDFFTGVFAPLRDPALFAQAFIDNGAVAWPGEMELAPDALYEHVRMDASARDALI